MSRPVCAASSRLSTFLVAAALAVTFVLYSRRGLFTGLQHDDVQNLYWAWTAPLGRILLTLGFPFTTEYRPLGGLLYRGLFELFGLHALPYRICIHLLLTTNLLLTFFFLDWRSGSRALAFLGCVLFAFHNRLAELYTNTGTVYDVLCFPFYVGAVWFYMRLRELRGAARLRDWVALYFLSACALNAKEMAVTLPAVLTIYELFWFGHTGAWRNLSWWLARERRLLWALWILFAVAIAGKLAPGNRFAGVEPYSIQLSWRQYVNNSAHYMSHLLYGRDAFSYPLTVALQAASLVITALFRQRLLWFWWAFAVLTPLPVQFIALRGFFVYYLPLMGWSAWMATVALEPLKARRLAAWAPAAASILCAALALVAARRDYPIPYEEASAGRSPIHQFESELRRVLPAAPRGARLLLLNDPFPEPSWSAVLLPRLMYRDPQLDVVPQRLLPSLAGDPARFNYVFEWDGRQFRRLGGSG